MAYSLLSECSDGYYGEGCTRICDCHDDEICDHRIGCYDKFSQLFDIRSSKAISNITEKSSFVEKMVIYLFSGIIFLTLLVLHYRRKYMKERDPVLPSIKLVNFHRSYNIRKIADYLAFTYHLSFSLER